MLYVQSFKLSDCTADIMHLFTNRHSVIMTETQFLKLQDTYRLVIWDWHLLLDFSTFWGYTKRPSEMPNTFPNSYTGVCDDIEWREAD